MHVSCGSERLGVRNWQKRRKMGKHIPKNDDNTIFLQGKKTQ